MPDPSIYNVGWICAIKPEYVAAQAFLDEKHDRPDHVTTNDSNIYTLGRLGKHYVVIGALSDGEYGIAAAVSVAKGMLSSFPNVRIGLMVGIGGGAPSSKNDIRLGDIVVSAPRDGHGGVFQYDFGKTVQNKKLQTVSFLNQPPELLRAALTDIQTEYEMEGHKLQEMIDTALHQRPRLRQNYQRPNNSSDILFQSGIVHRGLDGADCLINCCDRPSNLVHRLERTGEEDNPAIHYGTIASANQLMKDAFVRDRLAAEENVLCFEMEAAGLMNRFPCIVIRGICDYADSHKNKQWQGYAAMAATAYAKDLPRRISSNRMEAERAIPAVLESGYQSVVNANQTLAFGQLQIAEGASFDSHAQEHNRYCLPNTRVQLLRQIAGWAKDESAEPVFWLSGMAGTGKSTISRSVARSFADNGQLAASFFFKKGETDRGSLSKFFMTIAADLIVRKPSTASHIEAVLVADRSITSKHYTEQFRKFLLEPLSKADMRDGPAVIVVDALDECERENDVNLFLNLISRLEIELPDRIRVFVTSRPEEPFRFHFEKLRRENSRVILHKIPIPMVEHDIEVFLRYELSSIRAEFNSRVPLQRRLSEDWPSQSSLDRLRKLAVPLFIVAATMCRFISDKKIGIPGKLLERVLSQSGDGQPQLETTYRSVLDNLTAGVSPNQQKQIIHEFRQVVGSIILLATPLPTSSLAALLSMAKDDIDGKLDLLHSVLSIPSAEGPVRLLHLSFRDFLLYPEEPTMPFRVDSKQTQARLAAHCLRILDCLRKDLCHLNSPGISRSEISSKVTSRYLPPEVQYSCQYWVHHLKEADMPISDGIDAHVFLKKHLLHWIEALALIGRASESLGFLRTLRSRCQENSSLDISLFLEDAIRFTQAYMSTISSTPLQLYSSLLIFTPKQSKIRTMFEDSEDAVRWMRLKPHLDDFWGSCLRILEGHSDAVTSVAFSHASTLIASASDDDTARIWRADTGECVQVLEDHNNSVTSIAFSHDSTLIASASGDNIVRIWSTDVVVLEGHSNSVTSVVFSHDSTLIASGSQDDTIRIWCSDTGEYLRTLKGHYGSVQSVAFSHNSKLIASASRDQTIQVWHGDTGKCIQVLQGHSGWVQSVAFSHNSKLIASASRDCTVRIWRTDTGECEQALEGHSSSVQAVAVSYDSKPIASASRDRTVRIWRADTGECIQMLEGHSGSVQSIAFSQDPRFITTASRDRTVRIWRLGLNANVHMVERHSAMVNSVVISYDLTLVASASDDHTVRVWRAETGDCLQTLEGHRSAVRFVAFSHDSKLVVSASDDRTIRVWHAETGEYMQTLEGHSSSIQSVAFSHGSALLISASYDRTVRLWRNNTGECIQILQGHRELVSSMAFSYDSTFVALASDDSIVRIWPAGMLAGECVQTLEGHSDLIMSIAFSHDSTLVASASRDYTVRIWRADTGECVQIVDIGRVSGRLMFGHNDSCIITDVGGITISGGSLRHRAMSAELSGIKISEDWITWGEEKLLWLPVEFRPKCSAVSESTVVIGCRSGKVAILKLSPDCSMVGRRRSALI
ncbi:hypothetical protein LLEC1_07590 [Akanthomyces lecanii]|uniref:NACHT domain-containing protein n=1 Tax=Cordyceps confragosa TaxID=2714763 RepID=A0A179IIX6_CORDF|nr:hypothetical protein LLEC1_07590 [Akanthomyces lecanii]